MHTAEVNSVSEVFQFDNSYVVAYITKEYNRGLSDLQDIKEQITASLVKEKKASKIFKDIVDSDLTSIADANATIVVSDKKAVFSNPSIEGVGYEPELVGGVFASKIGEVSPPINGRNAVYVVEVINLEEVKSNEDLSVQKSKLQTQVISYANSASYNALKEAANIQDNRVDFY